MSKDGEEVDVSWLQAAQKKDHGPQWPMVIILVTAILSVTAICITGIVKWS